MEDFDFLKNSLDDKPELNHSSRLSLQTPTIIIVEDDKLLGQSLKKYLTRSLALDVIHFEGPEIFLNYLDHHPEFDFFCLVTDVSLENSSIDGLILIDRLKEKKLHFQPIVMTGFASIESAINATKKGIYHYLTKPFSLDSLNDLVHTCLVEKMNYRHLSHGSSGLGKIFKSPTQVSFADVENFYGITAQSLSMKKIFEQIKKVASSDSTILISGESGTGKEMVARAIHRLSQRSNFPQVSLNCGAIPADLLESELFGHLKGAFTGAIANRKGRFELAHRGTLFLDEIGDMPSLLQVKILRALQAREIEVVGGGTQVVDVRVIAATHRDLEQMVKNGEFREDLFYRLNVIPIKIPALRERKEDIPVLISCFKEKFVSADGSNDIEFSSDCMEYLCRYDWPGNVRELENLIERLVILKAGQKIYPEDLPAKIFRPGHQCNFTYNHLIELPAQGVDLKQLMNDLEDSLITQALIRTEGNKNQAAKLLGLNRTTLIEKMKKKSISL